MDVMDIMDGWISYIWMDIMEKSMSFDYAAIVTVDGNDYGIPIERKYL